MTVGNSKSIVLSIDQSFPALLTFLFAFLMETAADFLSNFIHGPLKKLDKEEELRDALTGVIGLNRANLNEGVVRKLIAALRKKKCKVETPRNKDPFEVLSKWIAFPPTDSQSSGTANSSLQEQGTNLSPPKGGKRKSGRSKRSRQSESEEESAPANNGGGPPKDTPNPPQPNGQGQGALAGSGNLAPPASSTDQSPNGNTPDPNPNGNGPDPNPKGNSTDSSSKGSNSDTPNGGKGVVFDQASYVSFMGVLDRFNSQLDALSEEQKRTREILERQRTTTENKSPPNNKRRKNASPRVGQRRDASKSPEPQLSPATRADISELDRFIADPFDDGGVDNESRDLESALNDFGKHVDRDEDDVLIVSEHGDSNDESDEHKSRSRRDTSKPEAASLKFNGLRPKFERTRAITHQNGFPEAIRWLRSKGLSLARFVAGHEIQMKPRDKQELDILSATLLSLVDQLQPGMVVQLDAADILIRRIMSLCLRDKLDDDYLDVLSNPSGSHLAPLEWLTEANKVYKIMKKAKDSQSSSAKSQLPTPRWRNQQSKYTGSRNHGKSSNDRNGGRKDGNRVPAPNQRAHQKGRPAQREKHDGGRGAGTDASSSSNNN